MRKGLSVAALVALTACVGEGADVGRIESNLTAAERAARAAAIRDAAADRGLENGLLLAGIAQAETGLAHCWSEATWACQGPVSADCDGGPVIAGAGDGPCSLEQGGLGMFQFDAGTYADTLAREGDRVLTVAGNTQAAVDFTVAMVIRSMYVDGVENESDALAWMNEVRPWNELWEPWIQTVTHYYNGCVPGSCSVYDDRFARYSAEAVRIMNEMGADFFYGRPPACGPIPASGATIDETDPCFGAGGPPEYWRTEVGPGLDGQLLWTNATDATERANWAFWSLRVMAPGAYLVSVYTDTSIARSRQTAYEITHGGATDVVVIDQTAANGFQPLGVWDFTGDGAERVSLGDDTGEPGSEPRAIVADAVSIVPAGGQLVTLVRAPAPSIDRFGRVDSGGCTAGGASSGGLPPLALPLAALVVAAIHGRTSRRRRG